MNLIAIGVFLLFTNAHSAHGDNQILIDKLTTQYIISEKALWKKVDTQLILLDRGSLLNEIYREHSRILSNDFGDSRLVAGLSLQKYDRLVNAMRSIDSTINMVKEHLERREYNKLTDLAKNTAPQILQVANDLSAMIGTREFWTDLIRSVGNGEQCQLADVRNSNELVFDVYKELSAASLKSYINIQLTQMILKATQDGNTSQRRADDVRSSFYNQYIQNQNTVKDFLRTVNRKKWMCDKRNFPTIYNQITRFIQGYVDNEINLNKDQSCRASCSDYTTTRNFGCAEKTLCAETHIDPASTRCKGTVYSCESIDGDLTVCPAVQKLDTRRYDFIRSTNGKTLGKFDSCLQTTQAVSWTKWFVKCSNCFCLCDENSPKSDRYFSLHDVTADIHANRIVTGVAITKRNRLFQFIIGESELLPYGKLNTTIAFENGDANANNRYLGHAELGLDSPGVKSGIDYHTLTYEKRTVNLDVVLAPAGKVVTGVRFHALPDGVLTIQIRVTDFDYGTGRLKNLDNSIWMGSDVTSRTELLLDEPDHPLRAVGALEPDWRPNQFIKFRPSDRIKDAAQVTIPFLDGTFVEGNPTLLSGVGLYYKGQPHFGGFIAPYLVAFDFGSFINPISPAA